jgi:hypothetical protein
MVEPRSEKSGLQVTPTKSRPRLQTSLVGRSSSFKYYIHDSIDACRFQLIGGLTEADIEELDGCWRTTKTSLGHRKLVLDLRDLKAVDDAGTRWLASMSSEGACYLPESYLRTGLAIKPASATPKRNGKHSFLGKLISYVRGARVAAAD